MESSRGRAEVLRRRGAKGPRLLKNLHPIRGAHRRGSAGHGCVDASFAAESPSTTLGMLREGQG